MWTLSLPVIFWSTCVIQLLGLGSIVALRLCDNGRRRSTCQRFFVAVLLALGVVTLFAVGADSDSWVTSGVTLSIMTVCGTFECRGEHSGSVAF